MSETKYATGPWSAEFDQRWPWTVRVRDAAGKVVFEQYGICSSTKQKTYQDFLGGAGFKRGDKAFTSREEAQRLVQQQIANFLLAAASPDLFSALATVRDAIGLRDIYGRWLLLGEAATITLTAAEVGAIYAALRKAEGQP